MAKLLLVCHETVQKLGSGYLYLSPKTGRKRYMIHEDTTKSKDKNTKTKKKKNKKELVETTFGTSFSEGEAAQNRCDMLDTIVV